MQLFVLAFAAAQEIGRRDRAARRGGGTIDKDASECVYSRAQSQSPPTSFIRISCTNCLCCWCCCGWWWCYRKRIKENFSKDRSNAISKAVVLLFVLYWYSRLQEEERSLVMLVLFPLLLIIISSVHLVAVCFDYYY